MTVLSIIYGSFFKWRYLTVGLPEIWNILEIQKMKNGSKVQNFMGKMNFNDFTNIYTTRQKFKKNFFWHNARYYWPHPAEIRSTWRPIFPDIVII